MRETKLSRVQSDIAAKIVSYVRQRDLPAASRLTETQLAAEFGVSRSPIRAALQMLAEQGVILSTANKGHQLARDASTLGTFELSIPPPADDTLYDRIALDRVRGDLPEQFTEAGLMRRYDVARGQLLRILNRFSHDGLVRRGTGHGWFFLPILDSEQAYAASYRFRILLEPAGLLEPTFVLDEDALARSRAAHAHILEMAHDRGLGGREIFRTNAAFHEMLARMSGNNFILQAVEQQNRLRQLTEYYGYGTTDRIRTLVEEHTAIMDALVAREREWAATLLQRHLEIASRLPRPS